MRYLSKSVYIGFFVLISTACSSLNPFVRDSEMQKIGPDQWHSLVVYFESGITDEEISSFKHNALSKPRWDGRGEDLKEGIGMYIGLAPSQAHGHRGFAITFYKNVTDEQRFAIKESIKSSELVYKVFEEIAPNDIKEPDLK
ncbi:MAG: hypothetical protein ACKVQW_12735 [Pyrinomonadaceae bacterium]